MPACGSRTWADRACATRSACSPTMPRWPRPWASSCMSMSIAPAAGRCPCRRRCRLRCKSCGALNDPDPRDRRRRRCGDHFAPLGPRLPAHAGAARDGRGDPRGGLARALGHQHPAVEGACAHRRGQAGAVARHPRRLRRPGGARRGTSEEYAYYPTEWRQPLHRAAAQGRLGPVLAARHRQGRQGAHARAAWPQLRASSTRRWASSSPSTGCCSRAAGSTTACSCRTSWSPRVRAASTPARRRHSRQFHRIIERAPRPAGRARWWCAACRWATPTRDAVDNRLVTEREPVSGFARFLE